MPRGMVSGACGIAIVVDEGVPDLLVTASPAMSFIALSATRPGPY